MQRIDEGLAERQPQSSLLLIVCALGAKFYAIKHANLPQGPPLALVRSAGNEWSKKALSMLFAEIGDVCVENTMAAVLLHDHELRIGNYASAFILTGLVSRMAQALQINLEYSSDIMCTESTPAPSASEKEARRRLMWSCYVMDNWVGSGVDQLTLLSSNDLHIQLPCDEQSFLLSVPVITEILEPGHVLKFFPQELRRNQRADNLDMLAYFVRISELRKKVLR